VVGFVENLILERRPSGVGFPLQLIEGPVDENSILRPFAFRDYSDRLLEYAIEVGAVSAPVIRRSQAIQAIATIGVDIAKSVFQVHCVDAEGNVALCRQLKRRYVLAFFQKLRSCQVGIEACASPHYWSTGVVDKETIRAHMQVMGRSYLREICALGTGSHPHEAAKLSNA
jgi:hypothetical protein